MSYRPEDPSAAGRITDIYRRLRAIEGMLRPGLVSVHAKLLGLDADDHPQYLTEGRAAPVVEAAVEEAVGSLGFLTQAEADLLYEPIGSGGGGPPTGPAGGDLSGTFPNPIVPGLADKADATATAIALASKVDNGDSRLSDARTPLAHAASHATGGADPITPASIGALPALNNPSTTTILIPAFLSWDATSGFTPSRGASNAAYLGGQVSTTNVANNWIEWKFSGDPGTYTLTATGTAAVFNGIATGYIDGVSFGTANQYAAATNASFVWEFPGLVIGPAATHTLRWQNSAIGAGSAYSQRWSAFQFRRTA